MAKYLFEATYSREGAQGVAREGGSSRRAVIKSSVEALGGKLEAFYFGFGAADAVVIVDLPDNVAAAAVALAVNSGGGAVLRTTVLLTPEEIDDAARREVTYRAPGT